MTRRFNAHFQNGVLIPDERIDLPENRTLHVSVIEGPEVSPAPAHPNFDDPADPMPEGGVELVDWWARHRIIIDPKIARDLAESAEHLDQDGDDGA